MRGPPLGASGFREMKKGSLDNKAAIASFSISHNKFGICIYKPSPYRIVVPVPKII